MRPSLLLVLSVLGFAGAHRVLQEDCERDFSGPECGWSWTEQWKLLSAENTSLLGNKAPSADANNDTRGLLLYYSPVSPESIPLLAIHSPLLPPTSLESCELRLALHMYQMESATFKMFVGGQNDGTTWETARFKGNSFHKWVSHVFSIFSVSQPFRIILEVTFNPPLAIPSHLAVDDLAIAECYNVRRPSTKCSGRQFQCPNEPLCLEPADICDTIPDCITGDDEKQECDRLPPNAVCTFESGLCGWNNTLNGKGQWVLGRGETPNDRTGPSHDHTLKNDSGTYLMSRFDSGREFGLSIAFTSPWFPPPPTYHRNIHSAYYNSCQIRFFYHKYGDKIGELLVIALMGPEERHELWRSYGNKGDVWRKAALPIHQENNAYQIQFRASRGLMGHGDIAIDDITLSPECFGIGVPENESNIPDHEYEFGVCGARGRFGPNEPQCRASYRNTNTRVAFLSDPGWQGIQRWTVPHNGLYTVFARGAGGGSGEKHRGSSRGASLRATFEWRKDDSLYVLVGQKGTDPCGELLKRGESSLLPKERKRRSMARFKDMMKKGDKGSGGGGGGATYLFKVDPSTRQRVPWVVAGGGGGLSALLPPDPHFPNVPPHGLPPNNSLLPINGYTGPGAGGGGGWDDRRPCVDTAGRSLLEGGEGGIVCKQLDMWKTHGGFGGGGGACGSGGGGGGYRGGDAWDDWNDTLRNGQGGTSYLSPLSIRAVVQPGSNPGDGSVVIIPAQPGCGCEHLCVHLDPEGGKHYCICPSTLTLDIDGYSCNGHPGMSISPKVLVVIILSVVIFLSLGIICVFFITNRYRKIRGRGRSRPGRNVSDEPLTTDPDEQLHRLRGTGELASIP